MAALISASGGAAMGIRADVSNEAEVSSMVNATMKTFKRIDILVNNAAVNLPTGQSLTSLWTSGIRSWPPI